MFPVPTIACSGSIHRFHRYSCYYVHADADNFILTCSHVKHLYISEGWEDRWIESTHKGSDQGKFKWTAGKFYGDADKDKGMIV